MFILAILPIADAQTLTTRIYGGSGATAVNGVATDSAGNIYVVGTTNSFDLPLLNPAQSANSGTQLIFSPDAGATWKPLGNLPNAYAPSQFVPYLPVAIDPTNPAVFYVGFNGMMFKSTDSGQHFSSGVTFAPQAILTITIDASNPSTVYAGTYQGAFKSTDGGATWTNASAGFTNIDAVGSLVIDPFHPKSLWASVGGAPFMSTDGANSWSPASLPGAAGGNATIFQFAFDSVTPGTLYVFGAQNNGGSYFLKSTDNGQTWAQLSAPFSNGIFATDPVRAGRLYAISSSGGQFALFHRSTDGGVTWQSFPFPGGFATSVAIDPANPDIVIAGSYRSTDNGATWLPTAVSRDIQAVFATTGKGALFATGSITSDIFLAKFAPDGKTLELATYFGGMGNETASGVQVDRSGNIWVAGNTSSFDLPVSKNAVQKQLKGGTNTFVAEFSPQGRLHALTYLGGSQTDIVHAIRLDARGVPWIYGATNSPDFPLKKGPPPALPASLTSVFLCEILPSELFYSASVDGATQPGGMTIDGEGNILLTGMTLSSNFPLTPNVVHGVAPPGPGSEQAFLIKLDSSGNTIFSTYLGGSIGAPTQGFIGGGLDNIGVAVKTDGTGIYLTGNTSATDFPTTTGVYQTQLKAGCQYPAFEGSTGFIKRLSIFTYIVDDVFVTKLSPDGKKVLYSTLLGGSCYDRPTDIAVTPAGTVFVVGETNSVDFPVAHPLVAAPAIETYESFVSMIGPNGTTLPFSSYLLAGSAPTLALGPDGILHIAGSIGVGAQSYTFSGFPNFPPPPPMTDASLVALNVAAAPAKLDLTGVLNAFSLVSGSVAPGEILELTVPDFRPAQNLNVGISELLPLETTLGGTQVLFDGKPALVMSVSPGKIVCIAPQDIGTNPSTTILVNASGTLSNPLTVSITPTALGLLSADGSGTGLANARNIDGKLNSPTHPAKRGTRITIYFTGAGVPPQTISTNFGPATIAPLRGFVPGIYAAYFEAPTDPNIGSPIFVMLLAQGAPFGIAGSMSQALKVYIE